MSSKKKKQNKGDKSKRPAKQANRSLKKYIIPIAILLFCGLCFSSSLQNEFVNWDDDKNFYEHEYVSTISKANFWDNTVKIFTTDVIGNYNPLTIWTFAIEKQLFGFDQPFYWHLNNLILHLICVFLVFWIGRRMGLSVFASAVLALLFGVHPMRVESVAWITERKDVLFGSFYLIAILNYLRYIQDGHKKRHYIFVLIAFVLSLFSKIQAVSLPLSLILIDYYFDGKIDIKKSLMKWPFFLGSLLFGILGILFLQEQGSIDSDNVYEGFSRVFIGSYQYCVYIIKSIVPFRLSPLYPYPPEIPWYYYPSVLVFLGSFAGLLWAYLKQWKVLFFGLGFFMVNVIFLLQFVGAGQGFLADRFTYIPYLGLFFIFSFFFDRIWQSSTYRKIGIGFVSCLILAYGFMTYQQNKIWKNSGTLWTHVLKYYKQSTLPYGNRANYYRDNGFTQLAMQDYNARINLKGNDAGVFNSRARLFFNSNNRDSLLMALNDYNKAIELKPSDAEYWVNRGATYAKLGDLDNAIINLTEGIRLNPEFSNAYRNRSVIYNQQQQHQLALDDIILYLKLKPYYGDMWYERGRLHNTLSQYSESVESLNKAIKFGGQKGIYYVERAKAYYFLKNIKQSQDDILKAEALGYKVSPKVKAEVFKQ